MDLATIKPSERTIEILHPASETPVGIRVSLLSIEDDRMKAIRRQITDNSLKMQAKNKAFKAEELERNQNMLMFTGTTGWEWYNPTGTEGDKGYDSDAMPDFNGEVPDYNQKNFMAVASELYWFSEQVQEGIGDTKAFFGNSNRS